MQIQPEQSRYHTFSYTSTLIIYFMLAESNNITELESDDCHKDDHVGNMITISCQNQTANSLHDHLQYLESIEIEINNPIYQGNTAAAGLDYMDENSIPDHEFDNPIYSIESEEESYTIKPSVS